MKNYAIYSSGRCGSHAILEYFYKHGYQMMHLKEDDSFWSDDVKKNILHYRGKVIVHYHGTTWIPNAPSRWTLIINF